jgi:hypothetical protein
MKIMIGALIVLVALGGSAMAASSTTQVSATLSPYISLAVPGSISDWTLSLEGDNPKTVNGLGVTSNAPWNIFVQSAKNPSRDHDRRSWSQDGHFWSPTADAARLGASVNGHEHGFLASALVLNAAGFGFSDVTLSDAPAPLASGVSLGTTPVQFIMKQTVGMTDPAENDYKIVIQFTASN